MNILIVSIYFPPYNSIAAYRVYSWAKWWSRQGHKVTVLTVPKRHRAQDFSMSTEGFEVVELPGPGLDLIWKLWPGEGAVQESRPPEKRASTRLMNWLRMAIGKMRRRYGIFYTCRMPDYWDIWAWAATRWAVQQQWDAVVTSGGPYSVHWVGLTLKKKQLVGSWGLDWRDLWTHNHIFPGVPLVRLLERHFEKRFHDAADIITTVSEPLANTIRRLTATPVSVVFNGFDADDYHTLDPNLVFPVDGAVRIVYTGTIYDGHQDPTPLFRAIKQLHDAKIISPGKLRVVFAGRNSDPTEMARKLELEAYCEYYGFLPRPEALRMQRDANYLLFLEYDAPGVEGILTGKLFEYLAAGPEIWAVGGSKQSDAQRIIEKYVRGRAFGNDIEAIREAVLEAVANPGRKSTDLPASLNDLSREAQALRYLELLQP